MQCKLCLLALLPGVPGVSVPEHHHELGHPHHGAVGGAQHRARAQQRPAAERVETSQAEMGVFGLCLGKVLSLGVWSLVIIAIYPPLNVF